MTELIVRHDGTGQIVNWSYELESYETGENEISVNSEEVDHRDLHKYRINGGDLTERERVPPSESGIEKWADTTEKNEPLLRREISDESLSHISDLIEKIDDPDAQNAVSEIMHVLTGNNDFDTQTTQ